MCVGKGRGITHTLPPQLSERGEGRPDEEEKNPEHSHTLELMYHSDYDE